MPLKWRYRALALKLEMHQNPAMAAAKKTLRAPFDAGAYPLTAAVRGKLEETRRFWPHVQRKAGVSRSWITQFMAGKLPNPGVDTLHRLSTACDKVLRALALLNAD